MIWCMLKFSLEESQENRVLEHGGREGFASTLIPINSHQLRITPLNFITDQLTLGLMVSASLIVHSIIGVLLTLTGPLVRSQFLPLMLITMKLTWMHQILISKRMGNNSTKLMKVQNRMKRRRNSFWLQHLHASLVQVITLG